MKFCVLLTLSALLNGSAHDTNKIIHSELNTAIKDLALCDSWLQKKAVLAHIDIVLLGGSELKYTDYTLSDITDEVPAPFLEEQARMYNWYGILKLLGIDTIPVKNK